MPVRAKSKMKHVRPFLASLAVLAFLSGCVSNAGDRDLIEPQHPVKAQERKELDPYPRYQTPLPPPEPTPEVQTKDLPIVPLSVRET